MPIKRAPLPPAPPMPLGVPTFAVVGHPNKGKSSIVATLACDDRVPIAQRSGTTTSSEPYKVTSEHGFYYLVDTPGFQRPRRVLEWLQRHAASADQRAQAVAAFVHDPQCQAEFADEVELLSPLVNGAAIFYVVDGSCPYGREYEAEMEILRWSGQPSMALINPIESNAYVAEWQRALGQYFKLVRVFNPLQADFAKRLELLEVFTHLVPEWSSALETLIYDLHQQSEQNKYRSADILARALDDLCHIQCSQKFISENQAQRARPLLAKRFERLMSNREQTAFNELLALHGYRRLLLERGQLDLPGELFNCEQWYLWGLNTRQLLAMGTSTGAAAGATIDAMVAGHSFMLGTIVGALSGLGGTLLGSKKLATMRVIGLPLGGFEARTGPIQNPNFPFVVIGRFLHLYRQLGTWTHAHRDTLSVKTLDLQQQLQRLNKAQRRALRQGLRSLSASESNPQLADTLLPLLQLHG